MKYLSIPIILFGLILGSCAASTETGESCGSTSDCSAGTCNTETNLCETQGAGTVCQASSECTTELCVRDSCSTDDDCSSGVCNEESICSSGFCATCTSDADCSAGLCQTDSTDANYGLCVTDVDCLDDSDCDGSNVICSDSGQCVAQGEDVQSESCNIALTNPFTACAADGDCVGVNGVCSPSRDFSCITKCSCTPDSCPVGYTCSVSGFCK